MRKTKKFLLLALSVLTVAFSAVGLSSCDALEIDASWENDGVLYYALNADQTAYAVVNLYDRAATKVVIPSTFNDKPVTEVGEEAFSLCKNLRSVEIGNEIVTIKAKAFRWCSSLTSVKLGDSITSIEENAFYKCSNLTKVEIGDSVTRIGKLAFNDCDCLINVEIGENVATIEAQAFYDCDSLTNVTIGNGVTAIGNYTFYNCKSLTSVYYHGTIEEWNEISFGAYNTDLTDAKRYYYSEKEPETEGNYWRYDTNGEIVVW